MDFMLPEVDNAKTKKAVEEALEKFQMFQMMDFDDYNPQITATYHTTPPSTSGGNSPKTEKEAVHRVDKERERVAYLKRMKSAVKRLAPKERAIIEKRYMEGEDTLDYLTYMELGYSERHYHRLKTRAFYKLAFILRIEVYKKKGEDE